MPRESVAPTHPKPPHVKAALAEAQNALVEAKKECVWLTNLRDSLRAFNTIESERIMMRRCIRHTCSGSAFIFPLSQ
jgi:hypothetical protein